MPSMVKIFTRYDGRELTKGPEEPCTEHGMPCLNNVNSLHICLGQGTIGGVAPQCIVKVCL